MSYNRRTVLWFSENHALVLREPCSGSGSDLREGLFNEEVTDGIEVIRSVVDMKGLADRVKAHGAINVGLMDGQNFAENMKKLTNSVDNIPNEKLEDAYTKFLKSFEQYIEGKGIDKIDSKQVLRDYLNTESQLYVGNEIIIHCLLSVFCGKLSRELNQPL